MKLFKRRPWEELREKGPFYYILVDGVCFWGLGSLLLTSLLAPLVGQPIWRYMPVALPLWVVGGLLWGAVMWTLNERLHRRAVKQSDPPVA